jgi:DNA-binding transcriptional ArsR family regulator
MMHMRLLQRLTGLAAAVYLTYKLINHTVQHNEMDQLSLTFAALADPTRRAILARLATGECPVTELAEPFDMSLPAVSKHLGVLERAGLISRGRDAQWRPCRIEAGPIKDVSEWAERYRAIWEQRLDRLDSYLKALTSPAGPRRGTRHTSSGGPQSGARPSSKEKGHGRQRRR